jgi:hypothetical protein
MNELAAIEMRRQGAETSSERLGSADLSQSFTHAYHIVD